MDRRSFLETTFASGLAASGSACASTREREVSAPPLSNDELDHKLGRLDKVLERLNHRVTTNWYLEERRAEIEEAMRGGLDETRSEALRQELTHEGELLRASMRTALLVSTVAELPEGNHADPRVVERVVGMADEADYALYGTLERLRNLDAGELAALDEQITGDTAPGMDIASRLDAISIALGVPTRRRLHLRRMAKHLDWRLQRERFSSVLSEVIGKVDRTLESLARTVAESGPELALASPDPSWVARTHEIVRFYAPPEPEATEPEATEPEVTALDPARTDSSAADERVDPPPAPASAPAPNPSPPKPAPFYDGTSMVSEEAEIAEWERAQARQASAAARRANEEKLSKGHTLLGIGGGLLALGGLAVGIGLGVGFSTGGAGFLVAAAIGGVAVTAAIILLIIGAAVTAKANRAFKGKRRRTP